MHRSQTGAARRRDPSRAVRLSCAWLVLTGCAVWGLPSYGGTGLDSDLTVRVVEPGQIRAANQRNSAIVSHEEVTVTTGDSLYAIFRGLKLNSDEVARILANRDAVRHLKQLHPGQILDFFLDPDREVTRLTVRLSDERSIDLVRTSIGFDSRMRNHIDLDAAAVEAPLPDRVVSTPVAIESEPVRALDVAKRKPDDQPATGDTAAPPEQPWARKRSLTVSRGDTLYGLFRKLSIPETELNQVLSAGKHARRLKRLHPGQELDFFLDDKGGLARLIYHINDIQSVDITRGADGYHSDLARAELEERVAMASGTINASLFYDGQRAGLPEKVIMQNAQIMGWDVDFALDIQRGDSFAVIHQELFKNGEKVVDGDILAAEFVNRGRTIRTVRYTDTSGRTDYYTPDGQSMRKAFLRTPVKFSRISSKFSVRRKHPVLHKIRAHKGVDYSAPRGTPVKATGDGKILFIGRKGGFGKTIILKHGRKYTTLYAHLSKYARGMKRGRNVEQGQIIGYVGSTGLATGPHLHYEFRVAGAHRNPLTVPLPRAAPIRPEQRDEFRRQTSPLVAQLEGISRNNSLADNKN